MGVDTVDLKGDVHVGIGGGTCRLEKLEPHLNLAPVGSASPELRL